jgi:hypothetical protein
VSSESELSTEDLARSGQTKPGAGRTTDPREGQAPAAGGTAVRPPGDVGAAPARGDEPAAMPGAVPEGGLRPAAGDPGSMPPTQPAGPMGGTAPVPGGDPATATRGESARVPDSDRPPADGRSDTSSGEMALLGSADESRFRERWGDAQARFVDDPQEAVRTADGLVAELMQSLAQGFSEHKGRLEAQWQRGGDPDTEELRQALQRYRSFFNRLLST